ncbi:hypothetical protein SAMN04488066_11338 [Halorubrum aquaticum]|uniref:Uncharacterized protein n=1 Tax=Halorubrum aquaticum TaxID=387340 RepID=A0A1I3BKC8_9EURY|nr:hypothetical protein [Halorubrum aquaticum]SFH62745.1 hypothetical protein SAMN04488066_11338 [Halorubrum aquaticum]
MTDTSFTLFELHLEEGAVRIGEHGLFGGGDSDENADEAVPDGAGSVDSAGADAGTLGCGLSGTSILGGLAVVALLAALGVAAARLLGDGDLEDDEAIDDLGA